MDEDLREHRLDAQADGLKLDEAAVAGIFAVSSGARSPRIRSSSRLACSSRVGEPGARDFGQAMMPRRYSTSL